MKKSIFTAALAIVAGVLVSGCCQQSGEEKSAAPGPSIIESGAYVGLWQKYQEVTVEDEDGLTITSMQPTNLFKCILPDGSYFMFRALPNGEPKSVNSRVELYGVYKLEGDTLCTETIVTNCAKPELSGISSDVHFNLPDKDVMNVYYNLRNSDGSAGSSEFTPEVWHRVATSL